MLVSPVVNNKTSSFLPPTGSLRGARRLELSAEGEISLKADRLRGSAIADANRSQLCIAHTPSHHCAQDIRHVKKAERSRGFLVKAVLNGQHTYRKGRTHAGAPRNQCEGYPETGDEIVGPGRGNRHALQQASSPQQLIRHDQRRNSDEQFVKVLEAHRRSFDPVTVFSYCVTATP